MNWLTLKSVAIAFHKTCDDWLNVVTSVQLCHINITLIPHLVSIIQFQIIRFSCPSYCSVSQLNWEKKKKRQLIIVQNS